jgi:hypothetical protein
MEAGDDPASDSAVRTPKKRHRSRRPADRGHGSSLDMGAADVMKFNASYRVENGDDLGSAPYWNGRLSDIDARLNAVESFAADVDQAAQQVIDAGLARISSTLQPSIGAASAQVAALAATVAALGSQVTADQNGVTTQLNDLLAEATVLTGALEGLEVLDGGTF